MLFYHWGWRCWAGSSVWHRCYGCLRRCCTVALVITVFRPWYLAHTALADGIFLVLVGLAALSWVVTLIRAVRETIW